MYLIESEGKQLLNEAGITVPEFSLVHKEDDIPKTLSFPVVLKAQTVSGKRGKAGLIRPAADRQEVEHALGQLWKQQYAKRPFDQVLIEPNLEAKWEYYLAFTYDTILRSPILMFSRFGGMDIEVVAKRQPDAVHTMPCSVGEELKEDELQTFLGDAGVKEEVQAPLTEIIQRLYALFLEKDCELAEINPLMRTEDDRLIAADSKIIIDDTALFRQELPFPRRAGSRPLTEIEQKAREIDERSHRGVVGRTFLELDGDIGFLSSGGGASVTCLDALIYYGGRPANFAEYSGNPSGEDVRDLTKLILSKEGLRGLWVVGPTANFTDVYETIGGILEALKEIKPDFPIVIRRAGPRDEEANASVEKVKEETGLNIQFFGEEIPMTETAKLLLDEVDG